MERVDRVARPRARTVASPGCRSSRCATASSPGVVSTSASRTARAAGWRPPGAERRELALLGILDGRRGRRPNAAVIRRSAAVVGVNPWLPPELELEPLAGVDSRSSTARSTRRYRGIPGVRPSMSRLAARTCACAGVDVGRTVVPLATPRRCAAVAVGRLARLPGSRALSPSSSPRSWRASARRALSTPPDGRAHVARLLYRVRIVGSDSAGRLRRRRESRDPCSIRRSWRWPRGSPCASSRRRSSGATGPVPG